jgi:hypothetical protein
VGGEKSAAYQALMPERLEGVPEEGLDAFFAEGGSYSELENILHPIPRRGTDEYNEMIARESAARRAPVGTTTPKRGSEEWFRLNDRIDRVEKAKELRDYFNAVDQQYRAGEMDLQTRNEEIRTLLVQSGYDSPTDLEKVIANYGYEGKAGEATPTDDYEDVREALREKGYSEDEWEEVLTEEGITAEEIEAILGGG